jgi:hypothetical protein
MQSGFKSPYLVVAKGPVLQTPDAKGFIEGRHEKRTSKEEHASFCCH